MWAGAISLPCCCHPFCGQQWLSLYSLVHCGTRHDEPTLCISATEHPLLCAARNLGPSTSFTLHCVQKYVKRQLQGEAMAAGELPATYRLHAAHCTEIAANTADIENKLTLLGMARAWLLLAEQAEKWIADHRSLTERPVEPRSELRQVLDLPLKG